MNKFHQLLLLNKVLLMAAKLTTISFTASDGLLYTVKYFKWQFKYSYIKPNDC